MKKLSKWAVLVAALLLLAAFVPATTASAASAQKVSIKLSQANVDIGKAVHISGTVTPPAPGQLVRLQSSTTGAWHTIKSVRLTRRSTYDFAFKPSTPNIYHYRVVAPHGTSKTVTLKVYSWQYLSSAAPVANSSNNLGNDCSSVRTINATLYPHACALEADWNAVDVNYMEWNLYQRCTTFKAVVGLDSSDSDIAQVELTVTDEFGATDYDHIFGIGDAANVSLSMTGHLRIKFTTLGVNPNDGNLEQIDLGNPQVHCSRLLQPA